MKWLNFKHSINPNTFLYTILIMILLFTATIFAISATHEMPQGKFIEVEYVWERAGSTTCRYDLNIHGFLSHHDSEPIVKTVYLVDQCGSFQKGDIIKFKLR